MPVREFIGKIRSGEIDAEKFYAEFFRELAELNRKYNFLITTAISKPGKLKDVKNKKMPYLPVSAKDCICTKGMQSAAGSKILEGYVPLFDATCIEKVKNEGGTIIGKTNQDEFGFGTFSTNSGFGAPKNPTDPERSCGGSSGGAAGLAKALEYPHIAIAESTGGSISCPASFCGVAGFTPTYGMVSRHGLIDYSNSLDKIGVIAKEVWDIALMLSVIAGHDSRDSTSANRAGHCPAKKHQPHGSREQYAKPANYTDFLNPAGKIKIGIPKEYFENTDKKVSDAVWNAIKKLEGSGASYETISLKSTEYALACYYIIACSEASTNLAKFCGMRYGAESEIDGSFDEYFSVVRTKYFGQEAKRRILLGTFSRMAGYRDQYYLKALKVRALVIEDFRRAFKKFDVLIAPTMPMVAPRFKDIEKLSPLEQYAMDVLTVGPNIAGIPHLSVPCGTANSMPVGLHIMGSHFNEGKVLQAGQAVENLTM